MQFAFADFCRKFKRHLNLPLSFTHKYYGVYSGFYSHLLLPSILLPSHSIPFALNSHCSPSTLSVESLHIAARAVDRSLQFVFKVFEMLSKLDDALPVRHLSVCLFQRFRFENCSFACIIKLHIELVEFPCQSPLLIATRRSTTYFPQMEIESSVFGM